MPDRIVENPFQPPEHSTIEEARGATRAVKRAREIKERLRREGRTFTDSTEIVREYREGRQRLATGEELEDLTGEE